jgi:hypothetical protein
MKKNQNQNKQVPEIKFNTRTFEDDAKLISERLVTVTTALTPALLISCVLLLALFNGYLEWLHYRLIIGSVGSILPALVFTILRFGSGIGGIHMIQHKDNARGFFFVFVSVALTVWATTHVNAIAVSIASNPEQVANAKWFTITAFWVALIGELLIAAYMQQVEEKKTNLIKETERKRMQKLDGATSYKWQPKGTNLIGFKTNNQDLELSLRKAKSNLSAFESKYRNGVGNPESMIRGIQKWKQQVEILQEKLN